VHLVEAADRLLPGLKPQHSVVAEGYLRSIGVNLVLNRKVVRVDGTHVTTDDGTVMPAHTLIWTTGIRGQALESPWPWTVGRAGRLKVDPACRVAPGVWAIGDTADMIDAEGKPAPQVAQGAIQMGRVAAHNLLAELRGEKSGKELRYVDKGYFVGLGKRSTVASLFGFPISGPLAFYLWALYYLMVMVGVRKQFEVALDMIKTAFVDHDTSQIHERRRMLRERDLEPDLSKRESAEA
jgi:NADH dehydrogenase